MITETALPTAQEAPASGQQTDAELHADTPNEGATDTSSDEGADAEGEKAKPEKAEKTEAERERDRLRRGIDRRTAQLARERAEKQQLEQELSRYRTSGERNTNQPQQDDEPLTLSRAELNQMVKSEAEKLAPTLKQQQAEIEHRTTVIKSLEKELGSDRFNDLADDLDEALGGLQRNGKATPATEAIFAADDPKAVIQYLADPDNADEAEAIGRMDPIRAGRAIAKLEGKLEQTKAAGKPQRSNAAPPIEPSRGGGGNVSNMPDPSNTKAWIKWANEEDSKGRR